MYKIALQYTNYRLAVLCTYKIAVLCTYKIAVLCIKIAVLCIKIAVLCTKLLFHVHNICFVGSTSDFRVMKQKNRLLNPFWPLESIISYFLEISRDD